LPAQAHHDFYATLGRIEKAMFSLQGEFSNADVGCGRDRETGFFIENNDGCGTRGKLSDKTWIEFGYVAYADSGRTPYEHQNEFAYMGNLWTVPDSLVRTPIAFGTHQGLFTSSIQDDGIIYTYGWWGDSKSLLAVFWGQQYIPPDFSSLSQQEKQDIIKAIHATANTYALKLEQKLLQFQAYDATEPLVVEEEKKHLPIIFVPGVGGSRLWNGNYPLWPIPAPFHMTDLFLKSDGKTPLTSGVKVTATDILRAAPGNFYGGFIDYLQTKNYTLDKDLFLFPYDWRLDNTGHLDALDSLVNKVLKKTDSEKVILIAHSMGGIITRAYVQSDGASKVDTLITIGTPFYGAVKPYYALVHGYDFGNDAVSNMAMKIMAQNASAVYQLLPRVPFVTDILTDDYMPLSESYSIHYKEVAEGRVKYYETEKNGWHFNKTLLDEADAFHSKLGTKKDPAHLPPGVKHYVIVGAGISTLTGYKLEDIGTDKKYSEVGNRKVVHLPQFGPGDGTVPLWSAEIDAVTSTYYVYHTSARSAEHGSLTNNNEVKAIVWNIIDGFPPDNEIYNPPDSLAVTDKTDFTLHSNAHLSIIDMSGNILGFDSDGETHESIQSGTFIITENGEYASLSETSESYKVYVNGTGTGEFTLDVDVTGQAANKRGFFSYENVAVDEKTIASFDITPDRIKTAQDVPALTVMKEDSQTGQLSTSATVQPRVDVMTLGGSSDGPSDGSDAGGGCLIATAAFGSELSPQVQFLRDFRDNHILLTSSGSAFMNAFNSWYYSFSPYVADYERQNPWLQQTVRILIYPLLGILKVSETAYSAIPGEYGALSAGLIASALIGGVYLSPLLLSVRQIRKARIDHRMLALMAAVASLAVIISIISANQLILKVTTPILVLVTIAVSAIITGNSIMRLLARLNYLPNDIKRLRSK
jgi:pimeloyl-ACP methyl ester carboxylesterase